jgi:hypothetical protein
VRLADRHDAFEEWFAIQFDQTKALPAAMAAVKEGGMADALEASGATLLPDRLQ